MSWGHSRFNRTAIKRRLPDLVRLSRNPMIRMVNRHGFFFDIRRFYACGYIAETVLKYLDSGDDTHLLGVQYEASPLDDQRAVARTKAYFGENRIRFTDRTTLAALPGLLNYGKDCQLCMIAAEYDPRVSKEWGVIPRTWAHWFIVIWYNNRMYPVDGWSPQEYDKSIHSEMYLRQFNSSARASAIMLLNK